MQISERYCASPDVIALLARDGIGWGHDIDCGCFQAGPAPDGRGLLRRVVRQLTRRA
jgi:hypothetical protein